jgi:hypothetical protein
VTRGEALPLATRAELLTQAGRGAVVLCVGGVVLAVVEAPASAAAGGDLATLRLLVAGERLALDLYERASAASGIGATLGAWVAGAALNERDHAQALAVAAPRMSLGPVRLADGASARSAAGVLAMARALEEALIGAYLGAVETLASAELRVMAAAIGANEAQHLAAVEGLGAGRLVGLPALPEAMSAGDARAALGAYAAGADFAA